MKKLNEMSNEELWQLFPIILTEHKSYWKDWYNEEVEILKSILPSSIKFYHFGSTAIEGIWAKPIIDIIIAVNEVNEIKKCADTLQKQGYIIMSSSDYRISLNKGYTESGFAEKVFHLHIRLNNDIDELYFRDYLNANSKIAQEYEKLKLLLWKKYEHNRDAYTDEKTDFVKKYTLLAKKSFYVSTIPPFKNY